MRATLTAAYKSGVNKYICKACQQPLGLKIRTAEGGFFPFFSHYQNSDPCPLKTQIEVDPSTSVRTMINNFESSSAFQNMLDRLTEVLNQCETFSDIEIRKLISTPEVKGYRRPALYSHFQQDKTVCFDLLVSNPMLGLLVGRNAFYKMQKFFYLWLFPSFNTDHQGISQKDILYMNRRNVFVFDSEDNYNDRDGLFTSNYSIPQFHKCAYEESIKQKRLMLNCYWQSPKITDVRGNKKISIQWNGPVLVPFDELCFDQTTNELYYHDSDIDFYQTYPEETQQLIDKWIRIKNDRWKRIYDGIERRKNLYMQMMKRKERKDQLAYLYSLIENDDVVPEVYQDPDSKLYGYNINGLNWIPAIYYDAAPFNYGYAWVRKKERWGVIDIKNNRISSFDYTSIERFNDKYYIGEKKKKKVLLNYKGKILGRSNGYDLIQTFSEDLFLVADEYTFRDLFIKKNTAFKWGLVDPSGNVKQDCCYDSIIKKDNKEGLIARNGDKIGYLDNKGNTVIPCKFNEIKEFVNGTASARIDYSWSKIDEHGNEIYDYTSIDGMNSFYYSAFKGMYGIADSTFKPITDLICRKIKVLPNGNCLVYKSEIFKIGWILIDKNGNELMDSTYREIVECSDGKLKLCKNGKWGLAQSDGTIVIPCKFDELKDSKDGKVEARLGSVWGDIDETGNEITKNIPIGDKYYFAHSKFNQTYQVMTLDHERMSDMSFTRVSACKNGYFFVLNKYWGMINNEAKFIIPCEYEELSQMSNSNIIAKKDSKCGVLSTTGEIVIPLEYYRIEEIAKRYLHVCKDYQHGVIDLNNQVIVPLRYRGIGKYYAGKLSVRLEFGWTKIPFQIAENEKDETKQQTNTIDLSKLVKGTIYEAVTTGYKPFGVFIIIPNIGTGLIPTKEVTKHQRRMADFKKKQHVNVIVLDIDKEKHRATFTFA